MEKEFDSPEEEVNVQTKHILHKWLNKAIEEKNKSLFFHCVQFLGKAWNVAPTVPEEHFNNFAEHLWTQKDNIKQGIYDWYRNAYEIKKGNESCSHAHSYESKVCFAIAPEKYLLISDSKVRKNMPGRSGVNKVTHANFRIRAEEHCANMHIDTNDIDALFREDFKLWSGNIDTAAGDSKEE